MSRHRRERKRDRGGRLNTPDKHKLFILDNWYHLAAIAWRGYQEDGRGFVDVPVDNVQGIIQPGKTIEGGLCAYFAVWAIEQLGFWPNDDVESLVEKYDPEREVVLFFHWTDGNIERQSEYRITSSPLPKDTVFLGNVGQIKVRI
jgi:hypothetical protein